MNIRKDAATINIDDDGREFFLCHRGKTVYVFQIPEKYYPKNKKKRRKFTKMMHEFYYGES